jgi:hypothetical protein
MNHASVADAQLAAKYRDAALSRSAQSGHVAGATSGSSYGRSRTSVWRVAELAIESQIPPPTLESRRSKQESLRVRGTVVLHEHLHRPLSTSRA